MNKNAVVRNVLTQEEFIKRADLAGECDFQNSSRCNDVNFFNVEIADIVLENKSIRRADFSFSKMKNMIFSGIDFEGSEFNFTELDNVTFRRCKLRLSGFDFAVLRNVHFEHCWMDTSSFDNASGDVFYSLCKVHGIELHHTLADLTFKQCSGEAMQANFCLALSINAEDCDFHRAEFVDSTFSGEMNQCVLTDADFEGSDCTALKFQNCKMRELNIAGATGIEIAGDSDDKKFRPVFKICNDSIKIADCSNNE